MARFIRHSVLQRPDVLREDRRASWRSDRADTVTFQVLPEHEVPIWEPWVLQGIQYKGWVVVQDRPIETNTWLGDDSAPDWQQVAQVLAKTLTDILDVPASMLDSPEVMEAVQGATDTFTVAQMQQAEVDAARLTVVPLGERNLDDEEDADGERAG